MLGWVVACTSGLAVLYGVYPYNHISDHMDQTMTMTETFFYDVFQRSVWSAAVAWIILACHWGYGGTYVISIYLITLCKIT